MKGQLYFALVDFCQEEQEDLEFSSSFLVLTCSKKLT